MDFRHHMPLVLLAAWSVVDVALLATFAVADSTGTLRNFPWDPMVFELVFVQGSVVAAWLYLSDQWPGLHAVSLLILAITIAICANHFITGLSLVVFLSIVIAVVNLPLGVLRDRGWRYRFHVITPYERRPWQFSLGELVGSMFVFALCLGLWQALGWLPRKAPPFDVAIVWFLILALAVWLPAVPLLVGFVRSRFVQASGIVLAIVHLRLYRTYVAPPDSYQATTALVLLVVGAAALILHSAALRWAGYRIERDPRWK